MLFINSAFHGNCQLESERERESDKITFMFAFGFEIGCELTACDTEREK